MKLRPIGDSNGKATAFLTLLIVAYSLRQPILMAAYLSLVFVVLAFNVREFPRMAMRERNAVVVFVAILTAMLPISVVRGETALVHYIVSITAMCIALVLTRNTQVYFTASKRTLVAAQLVIVGYLATHGVAGFPLNDMLPDSSSNGVTAYLILLQANYCIVNFLLTRRISWLTATITLCVCIVGYGRGSILAAAGILVLGIGMQVIAKGYLKALVALPIILLMGVTIYVAYGDIISEFVIYNTKIGSGFGDVHRQSIINEYLGKIDLVSLWTGASYRGTSVMSEYLGNPHNSFIRAHYIFGLPYLVSMLFLPFYLFHRRHGIATAIFAAGIWFLVMFRSFTEPVLFPTLFDFYYFAVCFLLAQSPLHEAHRTRVGGSIVANHRVSTRSRLGPEAQLQQSEIQYLN